MDEEKEEEEDIGKKERLSVRASHLAAGGDDAPRAGARVQLADVTTSAAGRCPWLSLCLAYRFPPLPQPDSLGQMEDLAPIERQRSKFKNEVMV